MKTINFNTRMAGKPLTRTAYWWAVPLPQRLCLAGPTFTASLIVSDIQKAAASNRKTHGRLTCWCDVMCMSQTSLALMLTVQPLEIILAIPFLQKQETGSCMMERSGILMD